MPLLTLEMFLRIAHALRNYEGVLSKSSDAQRGKIADYLDSISDTLRAITSNAAEDKDVAEHCAALKIYAEDLFEVLRRHKKLSNSDLTNILATAQSKRIRYLEKKDQIVFTIRDTLDSQSELREVNEAAGIFKATAARLRVPPDRTWWQFWKS
jgi:hypothetical protein